MKKNLENTIHSMTTIFWKEFVFEVLEVSFSLGVTHQLRVKCECKSGAYILFLFFASYCQRLISGRKTGH